MRKLAAYPRQNELAAALREVGRVERSLFMIDWATDPDMRRRALVGLNKGEAHHALKRAINPVPPAARGPRRRRRRRPPRRPKAGPRRRRPNVRVLSPRPRAPARPSPPIHTASPVLAMLARRAPPVDQLGQGRSRSHWSNPARGVAARSSAPRRAPGPPTAPTPGVAAPFQPT